MNKRLLLLFVFIFTFIPVLIFAADGTDIEVNNTYSQANAITFRSTDNFVTGCIGKIAYNGDEDWYSIYLPSGSYTATLTNNIQSSTSAIYGSLPADYDIYIYHNSDTINWVARAFAAGTTKESLSFIVPPEKNNSKYYIRIDGYNSAYDTTNQYKFMMSKGDTEMLMEAYRFLYYPHAFYGRLNSGTEYHTTGVAYSYGTKDSLSYYETKLSEADLYKSLPFDNWSKYSTSHPRPGRYDGETNSQTAWCGVDCSGFIYSCTTSSSKSYAIEALANTSCGTSQLASTTYSTAVSSIPSVKVGDISVESGNHVMMISRTASTFNNLWVIHADGYSAGRTIFESNLDTERHNFDASTLRSLN